MKLLDTREGPKSQSLDIALLGLIAALVCGGAVRFYPALTHDFPIGDGGLFLLMAQAVRDHHFALPATIIYGQNAPAIPFCYPPLAFYMAAFCSVLGFSLETILRFMPALWATAAIYAFWRLAKAVFRGLPQGEWATATAPLLWALFPQDYFWLIMGGGLTRAPALFFALMSAASAVSLWREGENRAFWKTTLFLALTILTHLERAHFLIFSLILICSVYGFSPQKWKRSLTQLGHILLLAALFCAPWWGLCWFRFGIAPFSASLQSGGSGWTHRSMGANLWEVEAWFPLLTLFGLAVSIMWAKKSPFLLLWMLLILSVEVRSTRHFLTVPVALSVTLGLSQMRFVPLQRILTGVFVFWLLLQDYVAHFSAIPLPFSQRAAMKWTQQNTPPGAQFLVIPSGRSVNSWAQDLPQEWFPALAHRNSPSTVQGTEWLPHNAFQRQWQSRFALSQAENITELQQRADASNWRFGWIFLPLSSASDHSRLRRSLSSSPNWQMAFQNSGASIYRRR